MVMNSAQLSAYVDPILQDPTLDHVATIRFGTKAVAYWPYRFVTDPDADDTLRLVQRIVESGRHVSIMAHFSHPIELTGPAPQVKMKCGYPVSFPLFWFLLFMGDQDVETCAACCRMAPMTIKSYK